MSVGKQPMRRHSFSATPTSWDWDLEAGYYELTLTPAPAEDLRLILSCADFPLAAFPDDRGRASAVWPLFVPLTGRWRLSLTCAAPPNETMQGHLLAQRVALPRRQLPCNPPPRGVRLYEIPTDEGSLEEWFGKAAARGVSFVVGSREELDRPVVQETLRKQGLLAVCSSDRLPSSVVWEGDASCTGDACGAWHRGGALSPLVGYPPGQEHDDAVGWSHHVTANGTLTLKHAAWADLAEIWYHPHGRAPMSAVQGLLLARVRGVASDQDERPLHTGSELFGGWQTQLPRLDGPGLLHARWSPEHAAGSPAKLRSSAQLLGSCIPAVASGDVYIPWFPDPAGDFPAVLAASGSPAPESMGFAASRLAIGPLWKLSFRPGRRQWPAGVAALQGYEQPSRAAEVLVGLRLDQRPGEQFALVAHVEVKAKARIGWDIAPTGGEGGAREPYSTRSWIEVEPGMHRILVPFSGCEHGWAFLFRGPRRSTRLRSLEALAIPLCVSSRASGPYWVETDITTQVKVASSAAEQRWSVRMMRGEPWLALDATVKCSGTDIPRLRARLTFDVPHYDRILVNGRPLGGTGSVNRTVRLIALKDSSGTFPNLALIPVSQGAVWSVRQVGTALTVEPPEGTPCSFIVAIGGLDRYGGATALRTNVARVFRPVTLSGQVPVRLRNPAAKPVAALAEVESDFAEPYWLAQQGWWWRAHGQQHRRGDVPSVLLPVRIPGKSSILISRGRYLSESVRPSPGCQNSLSLAEPERGGVLVRVTGKPPFDVPLGVEFRHPFQMVTCDGRPWHVHDGRTVWLPATGRQCRLRVDAPGEATPMVLAPRLLIRSTRWTGARLTIRLAESGAAVAGQELVVQYPPQSLVWAAIEGGEAADDAHGLITVRPAAQTVHLRFVPRRAGRR